MFKRLLGWGAVMMVLLLAFAPVAFADDYEPPPPGYGDPIRVDGSMVVPAGDPGQVVSVSVPLIFSTDFGWNVVRDITIAPVISTDPELWPFEIKQTSYLQTVTLVARNARPTFNFVISQQAKAGTYPIQFVLSYVASNGTTHETKTNTISTYVRVLSDGTEVKADENASGPVVLTATPAPSADFGQRVTMVLELHNTGSTLTDVRIKPQLSADLTEFPFVVEQQSYEQALGNFAGGTSRTVSYDFLLSEYVSAGAKPIKFQLEYLLNGVRGTGSVTAYVDVAKGNEATEEEESNKKPKPKLIISSYIIEPEKIYAGTSFTLEMNFTNTSESPIQNLTIIITNADEENAYVVPAKNGSNTIYVRGMAPGETILRTLELQVRPDTPAKPNMLAIAMEYENEDFTAFTTSANIIVPINQEIRVVVDQPRFDMPFVDLGMTVYPYFSIINMGKSSIYNAMVTVEGPGLSLEERFYAGTIQAGQQFNVDIGIVANEPGEIEGNIVVSFEDEYGDKLEERQPFTLTVQEAFMMPEGEFGEGGRFPEGFDPGMMDGGQGGLKALLSGNGKWWAIGGGVLVLLLLVIILRKRRAKKRLAELTEDDAA